MSSDDFRLKTREQTRCNIKSRPGDARLTRKEASPHPLEGDSFFNEIGVAFPKWGKLLTAHVQTLSWTNYFSSNPG
jgi:hypothetical protein